MTDYIHLEDVLSLIALILAYLLARAAYKMVERDDRFKMFGILAAVYIIGYVMGIT